MARISWILLILPFWFLGCSKTTTVDSGRISPTYQGPSELPYCATPTSFSPSFTITGKAVYDRRQVYGDRNTCSSTGCGLGSASTTDASHPAKEFPIRYAEVRVIDDSGSLTTCTETDSSGNFSFTLPQTSSTYTIAVDSRSYNSHLKASVLNSPEYNQFYSLTTTVDPAVQTNVGTLVAKADGDILGGAFNILDQLLNANLFLANQVSNCSATYSGCVDYSIGMMQKIAAYWEKGFNPNDYFGQGNSGLSFYLPGYHRLFILGGINGDSNSSDTDHFDNSVIIHEYGHFLEDTVFGTSDSPGGSHDGNEMIDPRLAWSEGWADFFESAVRSWVGETCNVSGVQTACGNQYIDTTGNVDGTTTMAFDYDLEYQYGQAGSSSLYDQADTPTIAGEGLFREFSITRFLYDAIDTNADSNHGATDNVSAQFPEIWAVLTKSSEGFKNPYAAPFRNVGVLNLGQVWLQANDNPSSDPNMDWSALRTIEYQPADNSEYGDYVSTGSTCTYTMTPGTTAAAGDSFSTSNLQTNNRYYHLHISSAGTYTLKLIYQDQGLSTSTLDDLDLYLYDKSAGYGNASDMVDYSNNSVSGTNGTSPSPPQTEEFTVGLAAGDYLINVMAFKSDGSSDTYTLTLNGSDLCPATIPGW